MDRGARLQQLQRLFEQTEQAHEQAVAGGREQDRDWAIWYADYLVDRLPRYLGVQPSRAELVTCLMAAKDEHDARFEDQSFPEVFAAYVVESLCKSDTPQEDELALYHFEGCGYCRLVRRVIDELGLKVQLRDILRDPGHRAALIEARGRTTVPVLRITGPDGGERWMPESRDIVRYLRETYG